MNFSQFFKDFKIYYGWFGFTALVFILSNILSTLDLILTQARKYDAAGIFLTLGFILLIGILEVIPLGLISAVIYSVSKKYSKIDPAPVLHLIILCWFAIGWLNLLTALFKKTSF